MMDTFNKTTYGLLVIFFAVCLYIYWFCRRAFNYWKTRGLEYLEPTIPFGNTIDLYLKRCTFGQLFGRWYLELKKRGVKHGGAYFFWAPVYIPIDPDITKRILITDFENFTNRGFYINEDADPLSGHIFNAENGTWRNLRAKMPSIFTSAKMRQMFLIMEKMSEQFVRNLDAYAAQGSPLDVKRESIRYTTDVIGASLLGIECNTMGYEDDEIIRQMKTFVDHQFHVYNNTVAITVPRPILKMFKFKTNKKELVVYSTNLCKSIVKQREETQTGRGDLVDTLLRLTKGQDYDVTGKKLMEPINMVQFASHVCAFVTAGLETSSSTVSFAMYELAKNPDCQVKLRNEINEVLARHDNKITYDALAEMKYLEYVVDETLRLHPVFPLIPRVCLNDYKVPGTDLVIEKDTFVMIPNVGIHRDPEYYPDPEKFDPERFTPENKSKRPFVAYLPFGEGLRMCIGKRFGLLQTRLGVLVMVRNFEITLNERTKEPFRYAPNETILRKTGDVWVNIKKLSSC